MCASSQVCYPQAHVTNSKRNSKNIKHMQLTKISDLNVTHLLGEKNTCNFIFQKGEKENQESILPSATVCIRSFYSLLDYYKMAPVLNLLNKGNMSFLLD